jgi:natural product precursor
MDRKLNKLILNQETVRNLTTNELKDVQGGFATTPACTFTCGAGCNSNQTCQHSVCFGTCNPA